MRQQRFARDGGRQKRGDRRQQQHAPAAIGQPDQQRQRQHRDKDHAKIAHPELSDSFRPRTRVALRAGAPDNVTVIVADVVEAGTAPSTQPQVVGSAALRRPRKRVDTSPAARAAALTRDEDDDEGVELDEEGHGRRGRWLRRLGGLVVAVLLVGAVAYAGYAWTQQQYYVGARDGHVTIFRGVAQDLGPITLHTAVDETDIEMAELPSFYRDEVEATISVDSRSTADERVASLRAAAEKCGRLRATGEPCGR